MIAHGMFVLRCAIRCAIGIILTFSALTTAHAQQATPETTWRLLDYIAVDYSGAVSNGRVIDQAEYAEMVEFSGTACPHRPSHRCAKCGGSEAGRNRLIARKADQ